MMGATMLDESSKYVQQGDVLVFDAETIPDDAVKVAPVGGRYVLREGEATGHAHAVVATPDVELFEKGGTLYLRVHEPTDLTHEEHGTHTLTPGVKRIGAVREVDPFENAVRYVAD